MIYGKFFSFFFNALDRKGRNSLLVVVLLSALSAVILAFTPLYISTITSYLQHTEGKDKYVIYLLGFVFVLTLGIQKLLEFVSIYLQSFLRINSIAAVSKKYLSGLYYNMMLTSQFENTGDVTHRLNQATNDIYTFIRIISVNLVPPIIQLTISLVILLNSNDYFVAILFFVYAVIFIVCNYLFSRKIIQARGSLLESGRVTYSLITDSVKNLPVIRNLNTFDFFFSRFKQTLEEDKKSQKKYWALSLKGQVATGIINIAFIGLIILWALVSAVNGDTSLSHFVLISSYVFLLISPIDGLGQSITELREVLTSLNAFAYKLDDIRENMQKKHNDGHPGYGINLNQITYKYDENSDFSLGPLSLDIPEGSFVTITGKNGSGKSTLISILTRKIDVYSGSYFIDDSDVKDINISHFCEDVFYVSQEEFIFKDTIEFNLKVANPSATSDDMIRALHLSGLMPEATKVDFQADLADNGGNISGGQRNKLSLARLYLRTPRIIILDEATSSMDISAEEHTFSHIRKYFPNATIINITHRPSSLKYSDYIYVMENGKIVESGELIELKRNGGYISDLINKYAS